MTTTQRRQPHQRRHRNNHTNNRYRLITGLTYLHKNKQVHRDIKPHNVLMHKSGMVKISDLGIAKAVNEKDDFTTTFTGTTLYMSPERLKGDP
jgi:serine/threonine protein kinase